MLPAARRTMRTVTPVALSGVTVAAAARGLAAHQPALALAVAAAAAMTVWWAECVMLIDGLARLAAHPDFPNVGARACLRALQLGPLGVATYPMSVLVLAGCVSLDVITLLGPASTVGAAIGVWLGASAGSVAFGGAVVRHVLPRVPEPVAAALRDALSGR